MNCAPQRDGRLGFTLIELIAVIAVITILSAILIATVGGANSSAKKAKTRAQFSQWGSAIELFRQEYGYYPDFRAGDTNAFDDNEDWAVDSTGDTNIFIEALGGKQLDGDVLTSSDDGYKAGNVKGIRFLSLGSDDLTKESSPYLRDGFGNTFVAILLDRDYDGMIEIGADANDDYAAADVPNPPGPQTEPLGTNDIVRTGVLFYSPGNGQSDSDIVKSWE